MVVSFKGLLDNLVGSMSKVTQYEFQTKSLSIFISQVRRQDIAIENSRGEEVAHPTMTNG